MKENARKQAEAVVHEAEIKADRLLDLARDRAHEVETSILDLRSHRQALRADIRTIVDRITHLLALHRCGRPNPDPPGLGDPLGVQDEGVAALEHGRADVPDLGAGRQLAAAGAMVTGVERDGVRLERLKENFANLDTNKDGLCRGWKRK